MHKTFRKIDKFYQNVLATTFRPRLWMPLASAVFVIMLILQAAFILPATRANEKELLQRLESDALRLVKASFDVWSFPSADDILRILDQNMLISDLRGGRLFRAQDTEGRIFGETPFLTPIQALKESAVRRHDPDGNRLDLFVSHEKSALQFDLILRLDTRRVFKSSTIDIAWELLKALAIALIGSLLMIPVVQFFVARPIESISEAMTRAAEDPANADRQMSRTESQTEIGEFGRSIDSLLKTVAVIYRQQAESAHDYFEDCPLAILEFNEDGGLASTNDAALELFRGINRAELADSSFISCRFEGENNTISLFDSLAGGSYVRKAVISAADTNIHAIIGARTANTDKGSAKRHIITIVEFGSDGELEGVTEAEAAHQTRDLNRRVFELKQFLESCMSIINDGSFEGEVEPQDLKPIIQDWHEAASRGGSTHKDPPLFQELPQVMGTSSGIESIFRHALTFVCLNSPIVSPQIDVQASRAENDSVRIFVLDLRANLDKASYASEDHTNSESQLFVLALKKLLKAENGSWIEVDRSNHANCVAFQLPAAFDVAETDRETA